MRPGYLGRISLLLNFFLFVAQAQCNLDVADGAEDQCFTAGATPANGLQAGEAGRTSAAMLLQKQAPTVDKAGGVGEQALQGSGDMELLASPVSLMTLATVSRPRPMSLSDDKAAGTGKSGMDAPLNEIGYKKVAKLKSQTEMETFVKRVISQRKLYIVDEGSLKGLLPYYDGVKAKQSYKALDEEISRAMKKKRNPWLSTKPVSAKDYSKPIKPVAMAMAKRKSKLKAKKASFIQTGVRSSTVHLAAESRPHKEQKRRHHVMVSGIQTKQASSSGWVGPLVGFISGEAIMMLGARMTFVVFLGSLLFGLFIRDESEQDKREQALLGGAEDGLPPLPPSYTAKDYTPLTDNRRESRPQTGTTAPASKVSSPIISALISPAAPKGSALVTKTPVVTKVPVATMKEEHPELVQPLPPSPEEASEHIAVAEATPIGAALSAAEEVSTVQVNSSSAVSELGEAEAVTATAIESAVEATLPETATESSAEATLPEPATESSAEATSSITEEASITTEEPGAAEPLQTFSPVVEEPLVEVTQTPHQVVEEASVVPPALPYEAVSNQRAITFVQRTVFPALPVVPEACTLPQGTH